MPTAITTEYKKCVSENDVDFLRGRMQYSILDVIEDMRKCGMSEEEIKRRSDSMKQRWKDTEYQYKRKISLDLFFEKAALDGTWDKAVEKREQTILEKYGVKHNWNGKYGTRDCDKTFMNEHGMTSIEYASRCISTERTSIELFTEFKQ